MKIKTDEIKVGKRIRSEAGDLATLKDSIKTIGLINPIILNENNELLSGFRRYQACKELEMEEIEVKIVTTANDKVKELDWEYHENLGRKELSIQDREMYFSERKQLVEPPRQKGVLVWIKKIWEKILSFFKKS
ncbi:MAG: ParB N-terminal domain-containing protein [Calditrichaeota bacterium]|nr:ParB N-terminal domain-containing protein [Calditrichota bacterium]